MNGVGIVFLLISALAVLTFPRRWAPLPLLAGACYITPGQAFLVGPFHFTVLRLLLLLGVLRALARRERLVGGLNGLDRVMLIWGAWGLCSSLFHRPFFETLVYDLGLVYNILGIYFLLRVFCQNAEGMIQLIKITALLLVPVALEMVNEKLTGRNLFGIAFGSVPEAVLVRDGKLRASGPFAHAILGGTVGALCVPLMVGIWYQHRLAATVGLAACLTMVIASTSSGPIMTLAFGALALGAWRWRHLTRQMRIGAVVGYIFLAIVMKEPPYFLMEKIDLTGSSTGWYRAELIRQAIAHLNEWWLVGSDYTAHWMVTILPADPRHCDITNHYLYYGVWGGLLLMVLFVRALWLAFRYVGEFLSRRAEAPFAERFLIWSLGAGLFAQAMTCFSIAFFDQSVMFLYLNLAILGSLHAVVPSEEQEVASSPASFGGPGVPPKEAGLLVHRAEPWLGGVEA